MASASTWRSPLSILMGARRNDDADLELRDDYFHPVSPAAPSSSSAAAPRTPNQNGADEQQETPPSKSKSSGMSSYLPFSYFGLTSPAPTPAKDNIMNGTNMNGASSPVPPPRSFPPPISESHDECDNVDGIGEPGGLDERHNTSDNQQYSASHPWFNQLELTESGGNDNTDPNQYNNEPHSTEKKNHITWSDQKSIMGTTFNFTNSIIGAGAMGLGGAFAASGGGISVLMLIGFAYLTKQSLDLIVDLSSCPEVIQMARVKEAHEHHDDNRLDDIEENDSVDDESFASNEDQQQQPDEQDDIEPQEVKDDGKNQHSANSSSNNKCIKDEEDKGEGSPHTSGGSSPLMAQEGENAMDGMGESALLQTQTKTKTTGLDDHPLASIGQGDREAILTMDVTQPRAFSPLQHLGDSDAIPPTKRFVNDNPPKKYDSTTMSPCTYEELGRAAYGSTGRLAVLLSKSFYAFGCLVAYVVVVRDNFGLALRRIVIGPSSPNSLEGNNGGDNGWLYDDDFLAFWVSALFMLPLSCPRTMKPLAKFSFVSILSIIFLILVVVYLFFTCTNPEGGVESTSFYENWIEIRSFTGFVESLGCFVFTFVCHHTVNLAYESLPPPIRNPRVWRRVSTNSMALALEASLAIGVFAYLTFGSQTPADVVRCCVYLIELFTFF